METIKISRLDERGMMLIVGHDKGEHTLNRAWQNTEVDFLLNAVGIGGSVNVTFKAPKDNGKGGFYYNIDKVDMSSGVKGVVMPPPMPPPMPQAQAQTVLEILSPRDMIIVAQVILKEANNNLCAIIESGIEISQDDYEKFLCDNVQVLTKAYKVALSGLNE